MRPAELSETFPAGAESYRGTAERFIVVPAHLGAISPRRTSTTQLSSEPPTGSSSSSWTGMPPGSRRRASDGRDSRQTAKQCPKARRVDRPGSKIASHAPRRILTDLPPVSARLRVPKPSLSPPPPPPHLTLSSPPQHRPDRCVARCRRRLAGHGRPDPARVAGRTPDQSTCATALLRDWADGRIDATYRLECYRGALKLLPVDLRVDRRAPEDISQALSQRIVQSRQKGG